MIKQRKKYSKKKRKGKGLKKTPLRLGKVILGKMVAKKQKGATAICCNPLKSLEAATRFELVNSGFADRCLTTWLCRQKKWGGKCRQEHGAGNAAKKMERETGFEPATSTLARSHSTTELFPPSNLSIVAQLSDSVNINLFSIWQSETFAKPHFLPNFRVMLKFQSSKYSMYSCG